MTGLQLFTQSSHSSDVPQKMRWNGMPLCQVFRAVVGEPYVPIRITPGECFEWKIDGCCRRGEHQRCTSLRTSKDEQLCRIHLQSRSRRITAMIDSREDRQPFRADDSRQTRDRL